MRLGRFFNTSAQFWLNLQSAYDLRIAEMKYGDDYARILPLAA